MTAFMGGFDITSVHWISNTELLVRFTSTYSDKYHQLYAGRSLVGVTESKTGRSVIGTFKPSDWPEHLTLLAVNTADRLKDFGTQLPLRPFNKAKLKFSANSWPSDSEFIDVTAGTTPGGAVDATNLLKRIKYDTDRQYEIITDPLPGTGTWNFKVQGRDDRPPDGNLGTALALSKSLLAHPPDLVLDSSGNRFTVAVASQQATFAFTAP